MIEITVRDGLGARITTLANALSSGETVAFGWAVNDHCPLPHETVFPNGIEGVAFTRPEGDCYFTDWNSKPFFSWDGAADRGLADAAYARIMAAMAGVESGCFQVGICGRFLRNPQALPMPLADAAAKAAKDIGAGEVFLLADDFRNTIAWRLENHGIQTITASCPQLAADLDRDHLGTYLFLHDWKTLLACQTIVAINGPTCLLNPARAAGRKIIYAP